MGVIAVGRDRRLDRPGATGVRAREKEIGGTGVSLEPPGPLLTHLHTFYVAYYECLPTRLNPLTEGACFSQVRARAHRAAAALDAARRGQPPAARPLAHKFMAINRRPRKILKPPETNTSVVWTLD